MISLPCSSRGIRGGPPRPSPPLSHPTFSWRLRPPTRRSSHSKNLAFVRAAQSSSGAGYRSGERMRTLFPGGVKRPEIKVPALVLELSCADVLDSEDCLAVVDAAVRDWVGIVVLQGGEESGGRLYEAARVLKSAIRDRAYFLISERVDVAAAVGSSGVVLSDQGLPTIVARNMLEESSLNSVVLPLVARKVEHASSALGAPNVEGADCLILATKEGKGIDIAIKSVFQNVKVPIFMIVDPIQDERILTDVFSLLQSGASGLVISLDSMRLLTSDMLSNLFSHATVMNENSQDIAQIDSEKGIYRDKQVTGSAAFEEKFKQFIEGEKVLLLEAINVIREAAPMMEEISLLEDTASRLGEPFLLVVVGEFNSGKSSVINALLGNRYLKEGVIPTTNEITLICYSEMNGKQQQQRCERHPDGQFICYLPASLLKEMNLVDTPGTNVILQRQQRLTEEFVPRGDLILFVISADRPLTESEVTFLRYIQQWRKKVVFVLNKADLYRSARELEEALVFIKENSSKLLNSDTVYVYPVSARSALEAKLAVSALHRKSYEAQLLRDARWASSGFHELERFLFSFMDGTTDAGNERVRLKLETPVVIAERLLNATQSHVRKEIEHANEDLIAVKEIVDSIKNYANRVENESRFWTKQTSSLIDMAKGRAVKLTESTLQLSNLDLITKYFIQGQQSESDSPASKIQTEVISLALSDARRLVGEYLSWLKSANGDEGRRYKDIFIKRWSTFINSQEVIPSESYESLSRVELKMSLQVLEKFSAGAAAKVFEKEIREVVFGTFGGLGAAGLSASLLTSVLPTTLEDLLALGLCSAGGLLAVSNLPARRKELIDKVKMAADMLSVELEEAMCKDRLQAVVDLQQLVEFYARPYQDAAQHRLDYYLDIQEELLQTEKKLRVLQAEIRNIVTF